MILVVALIVWLIALFVAVLRRRRSDAWRDLLAIGLIGAGTAGFFWRLLGGQIWMPAGGGDLAQFLYPTYSFAALWWRQGIIPLWNPYLFTGAPFVGDIQSGIFYPFNLLTFLLSDPLTFRDLEFLSVLHFFIAGAGMYAFLRWGRWQRPPTADRSIGIPAALAGAIAFEFSDLFITHFGNLNMIAVAAWTPLVLLFYRRAVTDRRAALAVVAGILLALAFFAGHIQAFLFIVMALVLFAVFYAWDSWDADKRGRTQEEFKDLRVHPRLFASYGRPLFMLIVVALVALGLAAPALLPSIEMTQNSTRTEFSYEQAAQYSLPPAELIGLLVPGFFGRGPQNAWAPWDRVEVGYLGVLPFVLALLALVLRRDAVTRMFGILALVGFGLALGGYGILHGWFYQLVPAFGQLRAPVRFIFLFDFAMAALAALGMETLLHALPHASEIAFKRIVRAAPWVFLLVALAAGSTAYAMLALGQGQDPILFARIANAANALAFFILLLGLSVALVVARGTRFFRPGAWAVLALVLIFGDLFSLGAYVDASTQDPTRVFDHPDAVAFLKSNADLFRIDPRGTGVDSTWTADTGILYGQFSIDGDNPLVLGDFNRYWESYGSRSSALYDLLSVKYLIGRKNVPLDREKFRLVYDGDPALDIYENTKVLPRAFVVFDRRGVPDHAAAFAAIHAADFDPARTVILEGQGKVNSEQLAVNNAQATAKIIGYGPNEIMLDVDAPRAGVLVLSEVFYPGWQAWVDDRAADVMRANYLFRAVEVPAGASRVRLLYDPWSFKIGVGLFAATILAIVSWSIYRRVLAK